MATSFDFILEQLRLQGIQMIAEVIPNNVISKLKHNAGYDIVVSGINPFDTKLGLLAAEYRENTDAILAAESPLHPANTDIVTAHFTAYTPPIYEGSNLLRLLQATGLLR